MERLYPNANVHISYKRKGPKEKRERWTEWFGLPYFPDWRKSSAVARLCLIEQGHEQAKEMAD